MTFSLTWTSTWHTVPCSAVYGAVIYSHVVFLSVFLTKTKQLKLAFKFSVLLHLFRACRLFTRYERYKVDVQMLTMHRFVVVVVFFSAFQSRRKMKKKKDEEKGELGANHYLQQHHVNLNNLFASYNNPPLCDPNFFPHFIMNRIIMAQLFVHSYGRLRQEVTFANLFSLWKVININHLAHN